jgi:galactose mutarotase-like enzyme
MQESTVKDGNEGKEVSSSTLLFFHHLYVFSFSLDLCIAYTLNIDFVSLTLEGTYKDNKRALFEQRG